MGCGIGCDEESAPAVAEQVQTLEPEMGAYGFEVGDMLVEPELLRIVDKVRAAIAALVVIDDGIFGGEQRQVRLDRRQRVARPAMHDDEFHWSASDNLVE